MQLEQISLYSHVRSGNLHGIVTNIDIESGELTICQFLYGQVHYVSLKDFVRKYRELQVYEYYLPKSSEDIVLQRIQELAVRIHSTQTDPYVSRDRWDCVYCIYGDLTRWESLKYVIIAVGLMLVIAVLGDMSILTHQIVGYLQALVLMITVLGVLILIYKPCKVITVNLGPELRNPIYLDLKDLSVGHHIVRGMSIGTKHHGLIYHIDSQDLDGIYVAHNTKDLSGLRGWIGVSHNTVIITTLKEFLAKHEDLQLVDYPCQKSVDMTVMVERIAEVVNSSDNYYYLSRNNCEAFVLYCKYDWVGEQLPHQINRYCHPYMFLMVVLMVMIPVGVYDLVVNRKIQALFAIIASMGMVAFLKRQIFKGPAERAYVETPIRIEEPISVVV